MWSGAACAARFAAAMVCGPMIPSTATGSPISPKSCCTNRTATAYNTTAMADHQMEFDTNWINNVLVDTHDDVSQKLFCDEKVNSTSNEMVIVYKNVWGLTSDDRLDELMSLTNC